jgi:CRP-like cAMP-binding protein
MISPELLRRYPFFGGLSDEQLKAIAMITEEESYAEDEFIFEQGEEAIALYLVVEGEVATLIDVDEEGEEQEELSAVPAGSVLGWSALVAPYTYTSSSAAISPTKVIAIDGEKLLDIFEQDCGMGYRIMSELVKVMRARMSQIRTQLASLSAC